MAAISTVRIAYNIGFSSALNPSAISAYLEMNKWNFTGDKSTVTRLKKAFGRGYKYAYGISQEVKYELKMAQR